MKLICNGADLDTALSKVSRALPLKKTQPILEGIKLSAVGDELTLTATDFDFTIINKIKADITIEGEILVPGKTLCDIAKKLSAEERIELSDFSDQPMSIRYGDSCMFLNRMNLDEYVNIKEQDYAKSINMKQKDFKELIYKTNFSAALDGTRPILKGCLLESDGDMLTCVALDGYRMALASKPLNAKTEDVHITVPAKALTEIASLLEEDESDFNINVADNKIMIDLTHTRVISTLLDGEFIKYRNTIPGAYDTVVTVNKKQLREGIERASIMSKYEKRNLVKMEIKEGKLTISSNSDIGESKEVLSIFTKGKDITIGFNAKYVIDCLKVIGDEFVTMNFTNAKQPAVILPVEGSEFLYLILPISLPVGA